MTAQVLQFQATDEDQEPVAVAADPADDASTEYGEGPPPHDAHVSLRALETLVQFLMAADMEANPSRWADLENSLHEAQQMADEFEESGAPAASDPDQVAARAALNIQCNALLYHVDRARDRLRDEEAFPARETPGD